MEKIQSWKIITDKGKKIQNEWKKIANRHNLKIQVNGIPALSTFGIMSDNWLKYKTYMTQEMLRNNFLASNAIFVSIKHDEKMLKRYYEILDKIFKDISDFERGNKLVDEKLNGPVCHSGFKRLN